jgi:hypothetical protein
MRSSRSKWVSGIGAVVLVGGLILANSGSGVPPAEAAGTFVNPFPIIIAKLNEILAKLSGSGGGIIRCGGTPIMRPPRALPRPSPGRCWTITPGWCGSRRPMAPPAIGLQRPFFVSTRRSEVHGGLATALGGGVKERAGWLDGSGRAVCPGQRLHHQHQRYYSRSPVGQVLVGVDECGESCCRVVRALHRWPRAQQR